MEFYVYHGGEQLGPYSLPALQDLLRLGSISSEDLAWCEGLTDWMPLRALLADLPGREPPVLEVASPQPAQARAAAGESRRTPASLDEGLPLLAHLLQAFVFPLRRDGFLLVIGGAVFAAIPRIMPGLVALLVMLFVAGYVLAYAQKIIQSSAAGDMEMPTWPEFSNFIDDILLPYVQVFATVLLCVSGPLWVLRWWTEPHSALAILGWVWLAAGVFALPMTLLAVTLYDTLAALNPLLIVRSVARAPGAYLLVVALVYALLGLESAAHGYLGRASIPIVSALISGGVVIYSVAVFARMLGVFYYMNRHRLGWFKSTD